MFGLTALGTPSAVNRYRRWKETQRRTGLARLLVNPQASEEDWLEQATVEPDADRSLTGAVEEDTDDALRRMAATRALWGSPRPESSAEFARIARREARKWAHLLPRPPGSAGEAAMPVRGAAVGPEIGLSWFNLGPTDARFEFNAVEYPQVDSGRVTDIRVNPQNPAIVYVATSGGGIWKTFNFGPSPTWFPITETIGSLAIGAMDMDPTAPDTLYAGTGDFVDEASGQILKTTDGGVTWSAPVALTGVYAAGQGGGPAALSVTAQRIFSVRVDPANPQVVLVGTDVGLFRSADGGASFALIDLPNSGAQVPEDVWSIVYTGSVGGVSRWALSGVYGNTHAVPPGAGGGGLTGPNPGDIWISTDAGATWSSRLVAGTLPPTAAGRITLGAGTPSAANPPVTVIYGQVGNADEINGSSQVGYWRSIDSGNTFADATGTLANPTLPPSSTRSAQCADVLVGGGQTWYNQAIAVDPADDNAVITGGQLCGLRTRNGLSATPTWENVSHWLPGAALNLANTANGNLPYVHADWHTALIVRLASGYRVFVGSDGGLFESENLFDSAVVNDQTVTWNFPNRGIVTHLAYAVASGDPVTGNAFVAFTGLQDNGTRFRDSPANPSTFNQVIGGDGIGATSITGGSPAMTVHWASVNGTQAYCTPSSGTCNDGNNWNGQTPDETCAGDSAPFFTRYANVPTNTTGPTVLTFTNKQVFRLTGDPNVGAVWQAISPCGPQAAIRQIAASPTIDGLYGVATNGGRFWVTSNCQTGAATPCTWTRSNTLGISFTSSIAFPPATPAGKQPGDVYIGSSSSPAPGPRGRIFITQDRGASWTPLHGNGTGFDLPAVPIFVVKYDPGDLTNNTIYAGTDLGLYRTADGGQTWMRYGFGLPLVRVTDLFIGQASNLLRVSTYGRGLWELYLSAITKTGGNGDFDRNQQIDFVDLAAMSARLDTSPTTITQPYYDWNMDVVGATGSIDESDLQSLLTRYGGQP